MRSLILFVALLPSGPAMADPGELAAVSPALELPVDSGHVAPVADESWPSDSTDALLAEKALEHPALAHAQEWLGTEYRWGGRGTRRNAGMDCLGLLYRAWGPATDTPWTRYPVNPSPLVKSGLLGQPVRGLAGLERGSVDPDALEPGDVLYLLRADYELEDDPLWLQTRSCASGEEADGNGLCITPYWPWHTVLYVDHGVVVHAAPGDQVRTQLLDELGYDALFVTRPGG